MSSYPKLTLFLGNFLAFFSHEDHPVAVSFARSIQQKMFNQRDSMLTIVAHSQGAIMTSVALEIIAREFPGSNGIGGKGMAEAKLI